MGSKAVRDCEEACAAEAGQKLSAGLVLTGQVKRLGEMTIVVLKLFAVDSRSLRGIEQITGADVTELDTPIKQAIAALLPTASAPAQQAPRVFAEQKDHFGEINVQALGTKVNDNSGNKHPLHLSVSINGVEVGQTPYQDGLPKGRYTIEVRDSSQKNVRRVVDVIPGETKQVTFNFKIPLTAEERAQREAKFREQQRKQREAEDKRQAALRQTWEKTQAAWQAEVAPIEAVRRPRLIWGSVAAAATLGLVITGAVLENLAREEYDLALHKKDKWTEEVDSTKRAELADDVDMHQKYARTNRAIGISAFALGGAAAITSVVLFVLTPGLPEEPTPPPGLRLGRRDGAPRLLATVGRETAGLQLSIAF